MDYTDLALAALGGAAAVPVMNAVKGGDLASVPGQTVTQVQTDLKSLVLPTMIGAGGAFALDLIGQGAILNNWYGALGVGLVSGAAANWVMG